jgi:hypothetical protein
VRTIARRAASGLSVAMLVAGLVNGAMVLFRKSPSLLVGGASWAQLALSVAAVAFVLRRRERLPLLGSARSVRSLGYAWFLAVCVVSLLVGLGSMPAEKRFERPLATAFGFALHASFVIAACAAHGRCSARWLARVRRVDVVLGVTMLSLVGLEACLRVWGAWWPSPIVWDEASTVSKLRANRMAPGSTLFGFPMNSLGYHDEAFFGRGPGDLVVCALADSFGVGVVPYDYNFLTVAERALEQAVGQRFDRVAIHNFGVAGTGLSEYLYLAEHEVPKYEPDLVLVCLFLGNDVLYDTPRNESRAYASLQRWAFWRVIARLVQRSRASADADALATIGAPGDPKATEVPAFVHDPELEPPHLSVEQFLRIERERFRVVDVEDAEVARVYARCFLGIDHLRVLFGERLRIVLIPDEFQVDEQLLQRVVAGAPESAGWDVDAPQRLVGEHCRANGVAVLDLLPVLRAHVRGGGARTYHLRDTHWNATGNRVGGVAIARWWAESVSGRSK